MPATGALLQAEIDGLPLLHRGKVRDVFAVGDDQLLIVATDRVSAFDVVLDQPLPGKGRILTSLSNFWFDRTADLIGNHLVETDLTAMPAPIPAHADALQGRAVLARRADAVPAEFIVRGYLAGSGFKDYQRTGAVCGRELPGGLLESSELPEPLFTPSTKAPGGEHDENISVAQLADRIGADLARRCEEIALALYARGRDLARERGILLADTKFELGHVDGELVLIDEVLTPDSSRYWPAEGYEPGRGQPSYDKQIIRDALAATGWDKTPPAPELPPEVLDRALARYREIHELLTGRTPS